MTEKYDAKKHRICYALFWENSGILCTSIRHKARQAWGAAINEYDCAALNSSFASFASLGYMPSWDFEKKKRWLKKRGAYIVKVLVEVL